MSYVKFKGNRILLDGEFIQKGSLCPNFRLVNQDLKEIELKDLKYKKKVLYFAPSLDTDVCLKSTKKLSEIAKEHQECFFALISFDLPFAQKRICGVEKIANITPLSLMRSRDFVRKCGILIKEGPLEGLCARAIVILDESNKVIYTELVEEITQEPDYENAKVILG
jgi:thiol peroxidase